MNSVRKFLFGSRRAMFGSFGFVFLGRLLETILCPFWSDFRTIFHNLVPFGVQKGSRGGGRGAEKVTPGINFLIVFSRSTSGNDFGSILVKFWIKNRIGNRNDS